MGIYVLFLLLEASIGISSLFNSILGFAILSDFHEECNYLALTYSYYLDSYNCKQNVSKTCACHLLAVKLLWAVCVYALLLIFSSAVFEENGEVLS